MFTGCSPDCFFAKIVEIIELLQYYNRKRLRTIIKRTIIKRTIKYHTEVIRMTKIEFCSHWQRDGSAIGLPFCK